MPTLIRSATPPLAPCTVLPHGINHRAWRADIEECLKALARGLKVPESPKLMAAVNPPRTTHPASNTVAHPMRHIDGQKWL